jgi:transposase-like protein
VSERAAPYHCPYCGEEDLRPGEGGPGTWECAGCNRAFRLAFLGLLARGLAGRDLPAEPAPGSGPEGVS